MFLQQLSILNFKNIVEAHMEFSPKINCFTGNNGMGKTSLLDAIHYLSFTKSFLQSMDTKNIHRGTDFFLLQGIYPYGEEAVEYSCGLRREGKKQFRKNKKEYDKLSDHIGEVPLVVSSPADLSLILGGSEERRKLADMVISQYDKTYLRSIILYGDALKGRNYLLRTFGKEADLSLLSVYEEQMSALGEKIFLTRKEFTERFSDVFQHFYNRIAKEKEEVKIGYSSDRFEKSFEELFRISKEKDFVLGYTSRGVHRDDFEFSMNGRRIKTEGSQGQMKTFLVALRFAQFEFLKSIVGKKPLLLLDDLFDKLDSERVEEIVDIVSGEEFGQIFLTDTNRNHLEEIIKEKLTDHRLFAVKDGCVMDF